MGQEVREAGGAMPPQVDDSLEARLACQLPVSLRKTKRLFTIPSQPQFLFYSSAMHTAATLYVCWNPHSHLGLPARHPPHWLIPPQAKNHPTTP